MNTYILTFNFNRSLVTGFEMSFASMQDAIDHAVFVENKDFTHVDGVSKIVNGEVVDSYKLS